MVKNVLLFYLISVSGCTVILVLCHSILYTSLLFDKFIPWFKERKSKHEKEDH